jgi:hypothetical protein
MNTPLPKCVARSRQLSCSGCGCEVNFDDPCAECPRKIWGPMLCHKQPTDPTAYLIKSTQQTQNNSMTPPSMGQMAKSATQAASTWIRNKAPIASKELLEQRQKICKGCEFWNSSGFKGTGRCMKCGCSTWAKLRMATEKCPIGKW